MYASGVRVDVVLKRVGIGRFQLRQLPPVQHTCGQVMLCCQIFEHVGTGGIGTCLALFAAFQRHLVKQDLTKLLGRSDIEFATGELIDFILKPCHLLRKGIRHPA